MPERAFEVALVVGLVVSGCARERGAEGPTPTSAPPTTTPAPVTTPAPLPPPTPPTTAAAPPPAVTTPERKAPPQAELFRAQDACLNACDQFACMKIADAYRDGAGVPRDVLAGRRYAIHACLECGKPTLAIADACPAWGVTDAR